MTDQEPINWRPTSREWTEGTTMAVQLVSTLVLGPWGPPVAFLAQYLFTRRALLFDSYGGPAQAVNASGQAVSLPALRAAPATRQGVLSLNASLTDSARRQGLRMGDPVGLVVTNHTPTASAGGIPGGRLVVPARIGERVDVTVPQGTYSLGAFAGQRAVLFSRPDPFTATTGHTAVLGGRRLELGLPLAARPATPPFTRLITPVTATPPVMLGPAVRATRCHLCSATYSGYEAQQAHHRNAHSRTCWACGYTELHCDCLVGSLRRYWNGGT
ncbi:hypothetical protein ALI22I_32675 [Saccharothrix sp. ALI-22-I]|uniref:hypothetical protein n=1 Tax=Saccharothrix sp. ALI-22-I TaxID=1933778 RepID=UPI00097BAC69|nr:hypothetical protein [Saccharothrix sp. ALI-22-I]ONI83294.1 hypothetical protein ALI22I_32675 [Saccharothrix sp. ALI-22-I]